MAIQDRDALALDALSIINDAHPHPSQPTIGDGVHLRYFPGKNRAFPLKGGFFLFRRRVGRIDTSACLSPLWKDSSVASVARLAVLTTAIGTLSGGKGQLLKPIPVASGSQSILGFFFDQQGLRFSLPKGVTARQFTLRVRFLVPSGTPGAKASLTRSPDVPVASPAPANQIRIVGSLGAEVVDTQVLGASGSFPQDVGQAIALISPADSIQIYGAPKVQTVLLELCYVPMPAAPSVAPTMSKVTDRSSTLAAAQSGTAPIPGDGWETIPNLTSVITLPLVHPYYPASTGAESINASTAMASSRVHYGAWQDSFGAGTATPGTGTITLVNGSPLVTGSGTNWTADLLGSLIRLPRAGSDYTAYAVMAVLAPNCIVLSRAYSGSNQSNAPYQTVVGDDFAELHDRVASLLQSPNDMRAAIAPPALDRGTVTGGKCVLTSASTQVSGIGTQWTANLAGCLIEIGPGWFQSTHLEGSNIYRIQAVGSATQLTLDRPFSGVPHLVPFTKCDYRIFARADGNDPNSHTPAIDFKPMDLLELASLMPGYAQAMGLYWIDAKVSKGDVFDYIVIADHQNRFSQQVGNALNWLNGAPDFAGDSVDGFVKLGVHHLGSPPLAPPTQLALFRLATSGARLSIAHPDRADSDVGISVLNASSWADPNATLPMPVMLNLSRLSRGTDASNLKPIGTDATGYDDLGRLLPSLRDPVNAPNPPAGWPADPIHFVDSGPDRSGLDVGWYSYRAYAIDLYGRFSADSAPIPWTNLDNSAATVVDAIHLRDVTPPPPPAGVLAWMLDDRDPYVLRDAAYVQWRSQFPNPAPSPVVGLRLNFRWPWAHQNQGPDLREFRVYALENPINARPGRVASVSPVSGQPTKSLVTFSLDRPVVTASDAFTDSYQNASLQAGNQAFPILASQGGSATQTTSVQLTVQNGGPLQTVRPDSNVDGAVVIPLDHPLHKELLNPGNWENWLAAIPHNLAGMKYDVEMVEDTAAVPFDAETNTFTGAQAMRNGSAFVLSAIPSPHQLTAVRPGIDVLELSSDVPAEYFVLDIQAVQAAGLKVVPVQMPNPLPLPTTKYAWRIGPRDAGLRGRAGSWNAATRLFSLDGNPGLSNVTPGADLIYIAAPGASPANLNFFFAIESLDAVGHTLKLQDTVNLSAVPNGTPLRWKVGRPVRHYEVFLPNPAVPQVQVGTDPSTLMVPTLGQPVRHGTIGVSSADKRNEIADQYWPARGRKGNESYLSGPAPVFRVLRDPPPAPTYTWNATRLFATRANYHDDSFFTVRWNNPGAAFHAHVFRAMDSSLFLAHWKRSGALPVSGAPPGISVLSGFDARKVSFNTHMATAATAQANADAATFQAESALAQTEYKEAIKLYDQLDDASLWWLAGRTELKDAYMQVTIAPLDLADPANGDRLGPDNDPSTFTASPTVCAYIDRLPGKSTNKYFYAVMLLDGAQNRSPLGSPTPPVYLPKVVPPRAPVITKVLGGELQITIQWAPNREPDLAGYRIYRTDDVEQARDIRLMEFVATVGPGDPDPKARGSAVEWIDAGLPGGKTFSYRIVAVDTAANLSAPCARISARVVDTRVPDPPMWGAVRWVLLSKASGSEVAWPANGVVPVDHSPTIRLEWTSTTDAPRFTLTRSGTPDWIARPMSLGATISGGPNDFILYDTDASPAETYQYGLQVTSSAGVQSAIGSVIVNPPG
jgi:hypothetical protein